MPKPLTVSFGDVYGSVANDLMKRLGNAQAAQSGPPISQEIEPTTNEKLVAAWWERRPEATDQAMMQLAQQKYAEHRQAGMDDEKAQRATAEDLTHFRYGQRMKLYTHGQVGFKEQVAEAKRLAKLAARETTPEPPPPAPTMPSAAMTNAAAMPDGLPPAPPSAPPVDPAVGVPPPLPSPSAMPPTPAPGGLTNGR